MKVKKTSSSVKVGALTLIAIIILIFTVMWIKGRSLSTGERIEVIFKDVNGIRAGSGVQMMGLRIGQIEEVTPVIDGINSRVKIKFVITEKNIKIPELSQISIQQSGLIGEQFIEITPPRIETLYFDSSNHNLSAKKDEDIYMDFNNKLKPIAKVIDSNIVQKTSLPLRERTKFETDKILVLKYVMTKSGIILDQNNIDVKKAGSKTVFYTIDGAKIPYPETDEKYTIIEPIRLSEFMDLQFEAARSLTATNNRINEILNDDFVFELQESVKNINKLTSKAITTVDKAQILLDDSKDELNNVFKQTNMLVDSLVKLSNNVNELVGDCDFRTSLTNASKSFVRLSDNLSTVLEDEQSKEILSNINEISKNMAEISLYVNEFAKDTKMKNDIKKTVSEMSSVMESVNTTLKNINSLPDGDKIELKEAIGNILIASRNVKTFSQKLNKRFLLFRLMF